jgi:opacity protein-like surface antigen
MHRMVKGLAAIALVAATASAAQAQVGIGFGVHGGLGKATGDLGEGLGTGFQVGGELNVKPAVLPIGLRVDVDLTQFGLDEAAFGGTGNLRFLSGSANAVWRMPTPAIKPYLLGGVGMYRGQTNVDGVESEASNEMGFQVGGGVELGLAGLATAIELKLVNVMTEGEASRYVPLTFRIMFGK